VADVQDLFKSYLDVIILERKLLDKLGELGRKKLHCIINQKSAELASILQEEMGLVSNIESTEKRRIKLQETLTNNGGEALNARQMLDYFNREAPQLKEELAQAINDLKVSLASLQSINSKNQQLLELSLDYIEDLKSLLGERATGTYSEAGTEVSLKNTFKILDKKI